jgi:hypothetical protein
MFLRPSSTLTRRLNILAIESSADDTCAAVVSSSRNILSNVVIKQHDMSVHPSDLLPDPSDFLDTNSMVEYSP